MNSSRAGGWLWGLLLLFIVALPSGRASASPVYNNGPIISGTPHVYFIWYGDWSSNTATSILPTFLSNLSGTSYYNIATSYSTGSYTVSNQIDLMGQAFVGGSTLDVTTGSTSTGTVYSVVQSVLSANPTWAADTQQGIFDVLVAPSTNLTVTTGAGFNQSSGFCSWHSSAISGADNYGLNHDSLGVQYAFIGDPGSSGPCGSTWTFGNSPSTTNIGADAMTSAMTHELLETVTDPTGAAWVDTVPGSSTITNEGADMCAGQYGSPTSSNGQNSDVSLNGDPYFLQQLWLNEGGGSGGAGGVCTMSLALVTTPEPASFLVLLPGLIGLAGVRWRRVR